MFPRLGPGRFTRSAQTIDQSTFDTSEVAAPLSKVAFPRGTDPPDGDLGLHIVMKRLPFSPVDDLSRTYFPIKSSWLTKTRRLARLSNPDTHTIDSYSSRPDVIPGHILYRACSVNY